MKHFGLTINLKDDPELIEQYKASTGSWKETLTGLKAVGITKMNIYLLGDSRRSTARHRP